MKSFHFLFLIVIISLSAFSQEKKTLKKSKDIFGNTVLEDDKGNKTVIKKDVFGNTVIEDNKGNKKTIGKDVFGNTVIEDNKGNKKTIGKDIFGNMVMESNHRSMKIGKDIFGNFEYQEDGQRKAYLKKDIFDAWIFTDANDNELAYSAAFWGAINREAKGNNQAVFMDMIDMCRELKNYKAKYSVDIFGNLQFSNNHNEKASLSKDIFNQFVYEDNKGNKVTYSADEWNYACHRFRSDKQAFVFLIDKYLFD